MKNHRTEARFVAWRFYLILTIILFAVIGLIARIFYLSVLDQHFLQHQGDERVVRVVNTPAFRGMIVDRNGFPLAVSTAVYSVWMNPQLFKPDTDDLIEVSQLLGVKTRELSATLQKYKKSRREFIYLKRSLSPEVGRKIKALNLPGLFTQEEYRRYYPEGEVTAHVVGFTNVDDRGQEGLELSYNQWLQGEPGKKRVIKDRLGRVIADLQNVQEQHPGHDLVLSIDRRIQYLAYRELLAGVNEYHAKSGTAIVLDTQTGEVLAMVNVPSFNPNQRPHQMSEVLRNKAITDLFEPGSTIKAFTVASAIESGKYKADSVIDTSPGWMRVDHNIVKDGKNNGLLSVTEILQKSSNMGVAKMVLSIPANNLWNLLHKIGFGEPTGVNFPGEQNGVLILHRPWGNFTLATLSFGYGLSTTALQLTRAYAVLANDGEKLPVSLLKLDKAPVGERVIDSKVAKQMLTLLESVVGKGGTAIAAKVPGYRVAGKTGTTKLVAAGGGYEKGRYNSSFIGIAPVSKPRLVVAVILNDPQGKVYYGGLISGPIFEKIMEGSLRILDVEPDGGVVQ